MIPAGEHNLRVRLETPLFWQTTRELGFVPRPSPPRFAWDDARGHISCGHDLTLDAFRLCVNSRIAARTTAEASLSTSEPSQAADAGIVRRIEQV